MALDGQVLLARRGYARVLGALRQYDKAVFQLVQAKRLAPKDAVVAKELGVAFYDKGLYDKALRELDSFVDISPEDLSRLYACANTFAAQRRRDW